MKPRTSFILSTMLYLAIVIMEATSLIPKYATGR